MVFSATFNSISVISWVLYILSYVLWYFEGENSFKRKTTLLFPGNKSNTPNVYSTSVLNSDEEIHTFYSQMNPLCEMLWSCKCFINWKKAYILWEINMAIILMLISFIGEWSLTTQKITSDLPQVTVKPVQVRLYRVHLVIDGNWTRNFSNAL
jgi:hypothetical protein